MKLVIHFLLFWLCCLDLNGFINALNPGQEGVCNIKLPQRKTRQKTYMVNSKKCPRGKRCLEKKAKQETYMETTTHAVCCDGWEYIKEEDNCKPQCQFGCENGTCTEPNVCQCDPPLILNNNKNACIEPVCDPPCVNGICYNTNNCSCNENFFSVNATYCALLCNTGYQNDPVTLACQPKCSKPCGKGKCTAPEICSCDEGHKLSKDDNYNCVPICDPKCENADCTAPNSCICHKGYEKTDERWNCRPKCEFCEHGDCISPNECKCHKGYKKRGEICEPHCDRKCKNGYCSAPNNCSCDSGYNISKEDVFKCVPTCHPSCINATCDTPNSCKCFKGFESSSDRWICKPKCSSCSNGTCIAPDVCICQKGYERLDNFCKPVCTEGCVNGYCSSPGVCSCNDGFMRKGNLCYKPCKGPCNDGTCSVHGICICTEGYKLENDTCVPVIIVGCKSCEGQCFEDACRCADGRQCLADTGAVAEPAEVASPKMAGLEVTWLVGGAIGLLLLTLVFGAIDRIWRNRKKPQDKVGDNDLHLGSVVYTVPDTLIRRNDVFTEDQNIDNDNDNSNNDKEYNVFDHKNNEYDVNDKDVRETGIPLLTSLSPEA